MKPEINLDQLRIASPCKMKWENMQGDERTRHCGVCRLNVYNVAGLSRVEALALLVRSNSGERVCMRVMRRADGTLITRDCPVGKRIADQVRLRVASLAVFMAGFFWFSAGRAGPEMGDVEPMRQILGKIAIARPLPTATPWPEVELEPKSRVDNEEPYVFEPEK